MTDQSNTARSRYAFEQSAAIRRDQPTLSFSPHGGEITYVDQTTTPLFVIQGANNPRTVKGESGQIVGRLREYGVEFRYDLSTDEAHGSTTRENELKVMADTATFFEERLLT